MHRTLRFSVVVLLGLLVGIATPAVAMLDRSSDGYRWDGNRFVVPLTIRDNSGVDRHHWPVTTGVPLPYGVVAEAQELRLTDQKGEEIPCQFSVLSRYWARDRSVRWVLLDFQVDVPAKGEVVVELRNDRPAAPIAHPITVETEGDVIRISTGPLTAQIDRQTGRLLRSVTVQGREVLREEKDDGPFLRTGEVDRADHYWGPSWNTHAWPKIHQLEDVTIGEAIYRGARDPEVTAVVERAGPLHTIVRVRGHHLPESRGNGVIDRGVYLFTARLHFFRGQSYIQVDYDIENADRERPQWCYLFHEAGLQHHLRLQGKLTLTGGAVGATRALTLGRGQEGWLYQARGLKVGKRKKKVIPGGYRLGIGVRGEIPAPAAIGEAARFLDLSDPEKGVAVAMRYLWEEAPRAISLSNDALVAFVQADSPGRRSSPDRPNYYLDIGERDIHDVLFYFHRGSAEEARAPQVCEAFEYPLFAHAPTAWYADTDAWYFEIGRGPGRAHRGARGNGHWQPERVGVRHHGGARHNYNAGGHHDSLGSGWLSFLRSGALADLERNLVLSRWHIAHNPGLNYRDDVITFGEAADRYGQVDRALDEWNDLAGYGPKNIFLWHAGDTTTPDEGKSDSDEQPAGSTYLNRYKYLPDHEHYALFRLFEYYYLTGSLRALDTINGFVNWDLNFQERQLFQGKMRPIDEPTDFDREPELLRRGHYSRVYTWMLYTNLAGLHATGSPVMDEFARWQVRRLLALLRHRHGQLTSWKVEPSRLARLLPGPWGAKIAEHLDLPLLRQRSEVATSKAQTWMEAQGVLALHEAYKTYGDERILDGLWAQADYFSHHVLYYPRLGMLNKITAMPNSPLGHERHLLKSLLPLRDDRYLQAFPYLYHYTGWPAVAQRYQGMTEHRRGRVADGFLQTALWEQEGGAKRSPQPPERITDLRVTNVTQDGVTLAWTSPRDDGPTGRAARYFVKYSSRPIVKFAPTDNPERTPEKQRLVRDVEERILTKGTISGGQTRPLPAGAVRPEDVHEPLWDPAWHRVDAFWMAEHVAGEPQPGPAGTEERFTVRDLRPHNWFGAAHQPQVKDLPRGTYYFAICSWDSDSNLSELSNVVQATLP